MKKTVIKGARSGRILSLILILTLVIGTALSPLKGEAAQTGEKEEILLQVQEEDTGGSLEGPADEYDPGQKEDNEILPGETDPSSQENQETPAASEEEIKTDNQTGTEDAGVVSEKSQEEMGTENGTEEELPEVLPDGSEAEEEELSDVPALLTADAGDMVPAPLGNVIVGRTGKTALPVSSRYVDYTRCWYVIRNNVKYWAVCARASAKGPVPPESGDSVTASCKYNYLNENVVNSITSWQKSGEYPTTVPIKENLGFNAELAKAVMVSMFVRADIWKESFSSFTLSYAAAHLLVSDLLFGDDDGAQGQGYDLVFHEMKSKVQKWMEDPANRALMNSCTAYIAYLWGSDAAKGRQPVIWVEGLPGVMDLHKSAVDRDGNPVNDMDLSGTVYALYTDRECRNAAEDIYGNEAVFTCDREGNAPSLVLPIGTYYLKETKAAPGMALDEDVYTLTLVRSTEFGNGINYLMKEVTDSPEEVPKSGMLIIQKADRESESARGGAALEGAVYDLIVDQEEGVTDEKSFYKKGDVYGSLTTDIDGRASLDNIPEGMYILREKKASRGYKISDEEKMVRIEGGKTLALEGKDALFEDIIKAPFSFTKTGSDDRRMEDTVFRVTCRESGKSWEIRTGKDGIYDSLREDDPEKKKLVYGTYLLEELPCAANEGFRLCEPAVFTVADESALNLGTIVNYRGPSVETILTDSSGNKYLKAREKLTLKDTLTLHDMYDYKGKEIRIRGVLADRETGKEVASSEKTLIPDSAEQEVVMTFELDASGLGGKSITAFEYVLDSGGKEIAKHEDIKDEGQTVYFPEIKTMAADLKTEDHSGARSEKTTLRDKVTYTGLSAGKEYEISGYLMVRETGEPLLIEGEKVTSARTFRPDAPEGSVDLDFTFDSSALDGKTIVCFEELFYKGTGIAVHADLRDREQSVSYPDIRTSACDTKSGDHLGSCPADPDSGDARENAVRDRVKLKGLVPGYKYTVKGILWDTEKKEALKGKNGEDIRAEKEFTASAEEETAELVFPAGNAVTAGKTIAVFEDLLHKGVVIASHRDPGDEDQIIHYPEIRTSAEDTATKSHTGAAAETAFIADRIYYSNLIPSTPENPTAYTVKGTLMKKSSGEPLLDREGKKITREVTFSPESPSGSVVMTFTFDASLLQGETLVCFEKLYRDDILAAVHADLEDRDQSIFYPSITTRAADEKTGTRTGKAGEANTLTDLVHFENLLPGTYVIKGILFDSAAGLPFRDSDGNTVTVEKTFTASEMSGDVPVTFSFRADGLAGRTLTVFESLCTREDVKVASHEDSEDRNQMIFYPEIITEAEDDLTGSHAGSVREEVTITDHVWYRNLIPSTKEEPRKYTLKGILMSVSTGEPLLDENGEAVRAETVFSPEEADGCADLTFTFSSSLLAGETLVCFESLYENGIEITVHADLEDSWQSIYYPSIATSASVHGEKKAAAGGSIRVEDRVDYKNLIPGTEYELRGILMDKNTGEPLVIGGKQVSASKCFTPEKADGTAVMTFTFDASGLEGKTLVVFETLYVNDTEVTSHADLEDQGQSILLTPPSGPPRTGDGPLPLFWTLTSLLGLAGAGIFMMIGRKAVKNR